MPDMENDDRTGANSELRYITLELMKLAQKRKSTFRRVAAEFVENAYDLSELLQAVPVSEEATLRAKKGQAEGRMPPKEGE